MIDQQADPIVVLRTAIDEYREQLGLETYQQLADHLGVSLSQVMRWRGGRWQGSDRALITILANKVATEIAPSTS